MSSRLARAFALAPLAALAAAVTPASARAQRQVPPVATGTVSIAPYAGVALFGDLTGGSLGIGLSTAMGTVYGAQVGIPMSPRVALIGNVAHGTGDITVGIPVVGDASLGTTSMLLADAGLEVALTDPSQAGGGMRPFLQAGGGIMRRTLSSFDLSTEATDPAFNFGGGLDFAIGRNVGVRLMAKDYVGRFDLQEATSVPLQTKYTHNVMFTAGLKLDL